MLSDVGGGFKEKSVGFSPDRWSLGGCRNCCHPSQSGPPIPRGGASGSAPAAPTASRSLRRPMKDIRRREYLFKCVATRKYLVEHLNSTEYAFTSP